MKDWIDKQFDRRQLARIRNYGAKARKAWFKAHLLTGQADHLLAERADQERAARASSAQMGPDKKSAGMKWFTDKSIVLNQIAALPVPSPIKDEWHNELDSSCLTDDTPG